MEDPRAWATDMAQVLKLLSGRKLMAEMRDVKKEVRRAVVLF
jgi:hypothetical protein